MAHVGSIAALVGQVRWTLRQRGFVGMLRGARDRLRRGGQAAAKAIHPFDTDHGVDTSGLMNGRELAFGHAHDIHATAYFGVPPSRLLAAIEAWQVTTGLADLARHTFVDVGCGKGRAVLVAAKLGFREVVGLELHPALAATAQRNLETRRAAGDGLGPARILQSDALDLSLPQGPVLLYLYNPFRAPVLRRLLQHLVEERKGSSASLDILYLHPAEEFVFADFAHFQHFWTKQIGMAAGERLDEISGLQDPCSLYRLRPSAFENDAWRTTSFPAAGSLVDNRKAQPLA